MINRPIRPAIGAGLLAILGVGVAAQANVQPQSAPAPAPAPAMGDPAKLEAGDVIAARKSAYLMSAALFGGMKAAIDRGDDPKTQAFAARSLLRWSRTIPALFPVGSDGLPSEALPSVWSDRAGFEARAAAYTAAAQKLVDAAQTSDKAGFTAAWEQTRATCGACHDGYRKPAGK